MLFAQHAQQLTASIASIQASIDELEAQLKALRNDKGNLEAELQTVLTLEGAAESAINQAQSFINAAESLNRTDLIDTFWQAMGTLQAPTLAQLPEAPEPDTTPDTEPTPPTEPTIDVTVTSEPEPTPQPKQLLSVGSAAFNPSEATLDDLKRYVRSFQDDDTTRQYGKLSKRETWETAARKILNS